MSIIDHRDKLYFAMLRTPFKHVRQAYVQRARVEHDRAEDTSLWMLENAFELIDLPADRLLTDDGREVVRVFGKAWALTPDAHAKRLAEAMELARQEAPSVSEEQPTTQIATCKALLDGQLCGGVLLRKSICPRCDLGKQGVFATLTCDVCGHVTAEMEITK